MVGLVLHLLYILLLFHHLGGGSVCGVFVVMVMVMIVVLHVFSSRFLFLFLLSDLLLFFVHYFSLSFSLRFVFVVMVMVSMIVIVSHLCCHFRLDTFMLMIILLVLFGDLSGRNFLLLLFLLLYFSADIFVPSSLFDLLLLLSPVLLCAAGCALDLL